ncbi:MAG: hypothetical protein RJA36_618 [Pseudomonadota bacterium]|jgi:predicted DNA-binding transcriptional regulator YafY
MHDINRLYRYKSLLLSRHAVPTEELMVALDISIATLKRDLVKLRERLNIPVVYDRLQGGYRLEAGHERRELPGLWLTSGELVALATLQQLLAELAPGLLSDKLLPLRERLARLLHDIDLDSAVLAQRVRIVHAGRRQLPPAAFETVAGATLARRRLLLHHFNRATGETRERVVSPQQLVHYRDNWYLDAWCHLRAGLRSFAVDALTHCSQLEDAAFEMDPQELRTATQASYGIFSGPPAAHALLRFSPERARWVAQESWHPEQQGSWQADGSYLLRLPYSDDRELLGDILRHGPDCVVLEPDELRARVESALRQTLAAYR